MADETKPEDDRPSRRRPAATRQPRPGAGRPRRAPRRQARAAPRPPAAPIPDLAGKTTNVASPGGAAAKAAPRAGRGEADDARRRRHVAAAERGAPGWAWRGARSPRRRPRRSRRPAASCSPTCSTSRRSSSRPASRTSTAWASTSGGKRSSASGSCARPTTSSSTRSGFYALITICTHLGCTPNYLSAENKFKCPCHGSGFRPTGVNFEGPAPRPLERARVVLADDGQILVDKSRKFQYELGQWTDPEAFLKA